MVHNSLVMKMTVVRGVCLQLKLELGRNFSIPVIYILAIL